MIDYFFLFSLLIFIVGCGKAVHPKNQDSIVGPVVTIGEVDIDASVDGQYLGVFKMINPNLTTKITGAFTFSREKSEDELVADIRLNNGGPQVIHSQSIRLGGRCPDLGDDLNLDGIIDSSEGEKIYGKVFIPLDGDISTQSSHDGEFPIGNDYGNYIYSRVTRFTQFMEDLRSPDEGSYIKLKAKEPLKIEERVVVILGVHHSQDLPPTVGALPGLSPQESLPIICATIQRVISSPGHIENRD